MTVRTELARAEPCPWCGNESPSDNWFSYPHAIVKCEVCGCTGPLAENTSAAITAWNTRQHHAAIATLEGTGQ